MEKKQFVYVLNKDGKPLMPTHRCGHVRWMLKHGKAKVVKQKPFTIRLCYDCPDGVQPLYGGTDPGRTNIGDAVLDQNGEEVYADRVQTRNKEIPKLMDKRAQHRRASRQGERKARQRLAKKHGTEMEPREKERKLPKCEEPIVCKGIINTESRFCNRARPEGWLTPTANQLRQTHRNLVAKICSILPVTDWTLEWNKFAFMKMEDGSITGVDYQNGRLKGFASVEEYVSEMQGGACAVCGAPIEHYHHIVPRHENGSDGPENIVGLCEACHTKAHTDRKTKNQIAKIGKKKRWAALSVLNQAMPYIYADLVERFGEDHVHVCYGWQTANERDALGLSKDHAIDAACIAAIGAGLEPKNLWEKPYEIKQFRRHDRARVHAQKQRTYKRNIGTPEKPRWITVAKNRRKGFEQKEESLETYLASLPEGERETICSQLKVIRSKRSYNDTKRDLPGTVFMYEGRRYVLSGQRNKGFYLQAVGYGNKDFPASKCRKIKTGGLVYL